MFEIGRHIVDYSGSGDTLVESSKTRWRGRLGSRFIAYAQTCKMSVSRCPLLISKITYSKCAVPASRAERHSIGRDTEAGDTVFMSSEYTNTLSLESIPDVASPIVIATEEEAS